MDFRCEPLTAEMIDPGTGEAVHATIEVRFDPLTGHSSRILPDRGLMPPSDFDLAEFAEQTRPGCPFCPDRIGRLTPKLPPGIHPEGRIVRGEAVLFPNLHAYSSHSAVSVYSPRLHYLPVAGLTRRLLSANLPAEDPYAPGGLALALAAYAELVFEIFTFALYGAPRGTTGCPLNLRLACRSNLKPFYRADSTFLERLHWEGAVDLAPEHVAGLLRGR